MTVAQAIARLNSTAGLDISDEEALAYLDEGLKTFAARSEWLQTIYEGFFDEYHGYVPLGSQLERVIDVYVDGSQAEYVSDATFRAIQNGASYYSTTGATYIYRVGQGDTEVDWGVRFYPEPPHLTPFTISQVLVFGDLEASDNSFNIPKRFEPAILAYARAQALSEVEDSEDLAAIHMQKFEGACIEARKLRNARGHRGPILMMRSNP